MSELTRAIEIINEARQSHVEWRDHLADPRGCSACTHDVVGLVMTSAYQQEWVDKYDLVLSVLDRQNARPVAQPTQGPPVFLERDRP